MKPAYDSDTDSLRIDLSGNPGAERRDAPKKIMNRRLHWSAAVLFLLACRSAGTMATAAPQRDAARSAFEDVFVRGVGEHDTAAVLRSLAPQLVLHIGADTLVVPREQFWTVVRQIADPFPDIRFSVDRVVAEGEWAAAGLTFRGTHRGTWHGIAPTRRPVQVTETFICRLERRQLHECWQQWDEAGLREQLTRSH